MSAYEVYKLVHGELLDESVKLLICGNIVKPDLSLGSFHVNRLVPFGIIVRLTLGKRLICAVRKQTSFELERSQERL